ncbi:MAG TPA: hypothetical protein VJX66_30065 [Amycolatopsis sp.]|nr:hypothetical protein [Amycolatopsis sp.]
MTMHAQFDGFSVVGAVEQVLGGSVAEFQAVGGQSVPEMGREGANYGGQAVNQC